ncbi:MAG: type II secretion system protein [Planctomycetes bacterium]|nr:type II secretion system protein [Planctomycetota bacterium]
MGISDMDMKEHNTKKGRSKQSFSLIELLIVIAVFTILMSMINSSMNSMMANARSIGCQSNLKTIYNFAMLYTEDNASKYPYAGFTKASKSSPKITSHESYGIVWDDLLSVYDGRNLDLVRMQETGLYINSPKKRGNMTEGISVVSVYTCPEDDILRREYGGDKRLVRSYSVNSHDIRSDTASGFEQYEFDQYAAKGVTSGLHSVYTYEIEDARMSIFLAESPWRLNELGGANGHHVSAPHLSVDPSQSNEDLHELGRFGLHTGETFNYLFNDGHTSNLLVVETAVSGKETSYRNADAMWSRQAGD